MLTERNNLINGGIQYFNMATGKEGAEAKEYNQKALDFFATYIDIAASPMFEKKTFFRQIPFCRKSHIMQVWLQQRTKIIPAY